MRFKFIMFMWREKEKTDTTKNSKGSIVRNSKIKMLKRSGVTKNRVRKTIDNMDNRENSFTPTVSKATIPQGNDSCGRDATKIDGKKNMKILELKEFADVTSSPDDLFRLTILHTTTRS
ncbi:hypothetical protein PIB30_022657 [Stylosanthes scabra]|uniref:Uncharacterized protein n=1 Tax=Stylosanthes scabra TaxID=79078 RepID=A0ABU6UB41_9FABA|nr:hypothetical protein [Stylosanthes scabra]